MTNDAIYYRDGLKLPLAKRVMLVARQRMYDLFLAECRPEVSTSIVDIGASDEESDEANMLEKMHPYTNMITCAGIGSGAAILRTYPGIRFQHIESGEPLPFRDDQFDIAYSNAVLEHVGGSEQRVRFVQEAIRVARSGFIAVPNKWFPVEHHTGLPLLHYLPSVFRRLLRATRYVYWTAPENLDFLDASLLRREWPDASLSPRLVHTGIRLGWFSSNLALIWAKLDPKFQNNSRAGGPAGY